MSALPPGAESVGPRRDREGALAEDLYCLTCGYNLRGLSGDPVRCPECGGFNDLGTVRVPAELIRSALREMETSPTWCVACAVAFTAVAPLLLVGRTQVTAFASLVMLCAACGWLVALREMRRDYDGRPGWRSVLFRFHLSMALCLTGVLLPIGLWVYYDARREIVIMQRAKAVRIAREILRKAMQRRHYRLGH